MEASPRTVLVSAGEASGDLYASLLVEELRHRWPDATFFGCTGPRLRSAGVETVVRAESLAVVGIVEVIRHLPRIYGEYRKLLAAVEARRPELAVLTDSPDFHLRVARRLAKLRVPVVYLIAPQVWAWRKGRLPMMSRVIDRLLCIFPFEEAFFLRHHVKARYIGHPLSGIVKPATSKEEFCRKHNLDPERPIITILPGSRRGEASRHLPELVSAVEIIGREQPVQLLLPASPNTGVAFFKERMGDSAIQVIDGEAWDAIAHADLALAASGTVTIEAALLGTPMVTFYKVNAISWIVGKLLVRVPFFTMVNLIAERRVVPELIQGDMTAERLSGEALALLESPERRSRMRVELAGVAARLASGGNVMASAADEVLRVREESFAEVV